MMEETRTPKTDFPAVPLPPCIAPCVDAERILLAGTFVPADIETLSSRGNVTTVASSPALFETLKQLAAQGERFDYMVFAGLSSLISQTLIGSLAYMLLKEDGGLIVWDWLLPDGDAYLASGKKGFLAPEFINTLTHCGLAQVLPPDAAEYNEADAAAGEPVLLRFKLSPRRWRVVDALLCDTTDILKLFAEVFGHDLSAAMYAWKYGNGQRGAGVAAYYDDVAVAHYGMLFRDILFKGKAMRAAQGVDVMVSPQQRGTLARKGPFFLVTVTTAERMLPEYDVLFGFPSGRHMKVGERFGVYQQVGQLASVHWSLQGTRHPPYLRTRVRPLHLPDDAAIVERLWQAMAWRMSDYIIGVRDAAFLTQRYIAHPEYRYQLYVVTHRFNSRALGIFVVRDLGEGRFELLDLLASPSAFADVIDQARRVCSRQGGEELFCWVSAPLVDKVCGKNGEVRELDACTPACVWGPWLPVEALRDRWWLMGGDTDFH